MYKLGIPVSGNVSNGYYPEDCSADANGTNCTKLLNITVTASMHGKSYQCLSYDRDPHPMKYYSRGGYMIVKDIGNDCLTSASIGTTNVEVLPTSTSSLPYPSPSSTTAKVMRCPTATLAPTSNPTTDTTATDVVAGSVLGLQPLQATIPLILLCTYLIL
ncbi:hypothetical protein GBAR_LOCUS18439 [Geodia barretti]|nr:hypothetical protein GBAR_LOCUS18439 [Geodia barretti]